MTIHPIQASCDSARGAADCFDFDGANCQPLEWSCHQAATDVVFPFLMGVAQSVGASHGLH